MRQKHGEQENAEGTLNLRLVAVRTWHCQLQLWGFFCCFFWLVFLFVFFFPESRVPVGCWGRGVCRVWHNEG